MANPILTNELAEQIVSQVNQIIDKTIALCNLDGLVVASSDESVIGSVLEEIVSLKVDEPKQIKQSKRLMAVTPLYFSNVHAATLIIYDDESWQDHVKLVKSLAELLAERYLELQEPVPDSKDTIIYRLLKSEVIEDLEDFSAEATRAGFDLTKPRIVMAIRLTNFWQTFFKGEQEAESREANIVRFRNKIEQALNGFFTASADNIVAYLGDDQFVVLKDVSTTSEEKFTELLKKNFDTIFATVKSSVITDISVGIGSYHDGLAGLRESYREAALALELGERMWGSGKLYHSNSLGIAGIIAETSVEKKIDFTDRLLGPLLPHQELVRTMEEFFRHNLNLTNAADALKIHRNTLIYRLDKITSIVDLDPRIFQEAVQIYLALLIKRILG
jgi:carbohydrate diacid regulator